MTDGFASIIEQLERQKAAIERALAALRDGLELADLFNQRFFGVDDQCESLDSVQVPVDVVTSKFIDSCVRPSVSNRSHLFHVVPCF